MSTPTRPPLPDHVELTVTVEAAGTVLADIRAARAKLADLVPEGSKCDWLGNDYTNESMPRISFLVTLESFSKFLGLNVGISVA